MWSMNARMTIIYQVRCASPWRATEARVKAREDVARSRGASQTKRTFWRDGRRKSAVCVATSTSRSTRGSLLSTTGACTTGKERESSGAATAIYLLCKCKSDWHTRPLPPLPVHTKGLHMLGGLACAEIDYGRLRGARLLHLIEPSQTPGL